MDELKNGDYVEAVYKGSKYYGTVGRIDTKWGDAVLTMAPGVTMILPLKDMSKTKRGADNGTYNI